MIWFQTDPHFFHSNILRFTDNRYISKPLIRPGFSTIEEMNELILQNHNAVVGQFEKVYWLGDITFNVTPEFIAFFKRFNGKHRLIFGNHDKIEDLVLSGLFEKFYGTWRVFGETKSYIPFCLTHIPIDVLSIRGLFNVHGHIHQNNSPTRRHINICPEVTNYQPTSFDDLQAEMKIRKKELNL